MQTNDLETITTTFVGQVESATKYEIDADNKGASLWVTKPTSGRNPNVIGREIIKYACPTTCSPNSKPTTTPEIFNSRA